jgi:hypothetical protein
MTMFVNQTQSEDPGAIREILPKDLEMISGGIYKAEGQRDFTEKEAELAWRLSGLR